MKITYLITLVFLQIHVQCVDGDVAMITDSLFGAMFDKYQPALAPFCEHGVAVNVTLDIALRQLINLNEKEQTVTTNVWIRMGWHDCRLAWNISEYSNISRLVTTYESVWTPDLAVYDSSAEEGMMPGIGDYRAQLNSSGYIQYNFPTVLRSICRVQVTYFPFDRQTCVLTFGSWSHTMVDIDIHPKKATGDLSSYIPNNEWDILSLETERHVVPLYGGLVYVDVRYKIAMKRRPEFYMMTVMFPCLLVSAIATIGFLLPPESGEKVSLKVTVLLSLAVFLLVISDFLPPSAEQFPIIGSYFAVSMVLVSFSLVLAVLVLNVHFRGDDGKRVPAWLRKIFLNKYTTCCSYDPKSSQKRDQTNTFYPVVGNSWHEDENHSIKVGETTSIVEENHSAAGHVAHTLERKLETAEDVQIKSLFKEQLTVLKTITKHIEEQNVHDDVCREWQQMARVLDRLFLLIYIITSVVVTVQFLMPLIQA